MSSTQEVIVRVGRESNKQFNVMKFGSALNVEPNKWKSCQMAYENDVKDIKAENDSEFKEFGAGSEFGRKQKEEMRRKRFTKKSNANQPWILETGGEQPKKYKGLRLGGVSENTSYYAFVETPDGALEAFPIEEWYNFTQIPRNKTLTAEEAEEKFVKRKKILNYFPVMINKKRRDEEMAENSGKSKAKIKNELKVSEMDDWDSDNDNKPKTKKAKKRLKAKKSIKKKNKKKGSDDDSEPQEESDEGDFDHKEVDYISDSSDNEEENEKIDKELIGVEDEDALRQLVLSDDEDEEKDKDGSKAIFASLCFDSDKNSSEADKKWKFKDKLSVNFDSPPPSSSDSESDDPDSVDDKKSALLAPVKLESDISSRGSSGSPTLTINIGNGSSNDLNKLKRKNSSNDSPNAKKSKLSSDNSKGITKEAVRRYLMRKPMTSTDLLRKFKNKVSVKEDLVQTIVQILKRLNPEIQTIGDKHYFSLKPT